MKTIVHYTLEETGITQKELAERLGVSAAQVSRWKNERDKVPEGHHRAMRAMFQCGEFDPETIRICGSKENAQAWNEALIRECQFSDYPFDKVIDDEVERSYILQLFHEAGVDMKAPPPPGWEAEDVDHSVQFAISGYLNDMGWRYAWLSQMVPGDGENLFMATYDLTNELYKISFVFGEHSLEALGADRNAISRHELLKTNGDTILDIYKLANAEGVTITQNLFRLLEPCECASYWADDMAEFPLPAYSPRQAMGYNERQTLNYAESADFGVQLLNRRLDVIEKALGIQNSKRKKQKLIDDLHDEFKGR